MLDLTSIRIIISFISWAEIWWRSSVESISHFWARWQCIVFSLSVLIRWKCNKYSLELSIFSSYMNASVLIKSFKNTESFFCHWYKYPTTFLIVRIIEKNNTLWWYFRSLNGMNWATVCLLIWFEDHDKTQF